MTAVVLLIRVHGTFMCVHTLTHTHTCTAAFEDLLRHSSVAPEVREETDHPPLYKSYSVEDVATEKPSDMIEVKQPSTPK